MKTEFELEKKEKFYMCYSVGVPKGTPREHYTISKHDISTMKQSVVAFVGEYIVVAERDEFYGGEKSKRYQSKLMVDPTWGTLFRCAKAAQQRTLDLHHAFFEGAYTPTMNGKQRTVVVNGREIPILHLSLGS